MLFLKLFVYAFEVQEKNLVELCGITSKKVSWRHFIAVESLILGVLSHILNAPASLRRTKWWVGQKRCSQDSSSRWMDIFHCIANKGSEQLKFETKYIENNIKDSRRRERDGN